MKIIQVVGYKNSGKTSLIKQLVELFSRKNLVVGTLKHHGHGGDIDLPESRDSTDQFESGAFISGVQGETITQLTLHNLHFNRLIDIYSTLPIDLLLIEGYKQADYPKIVLVKNSDDLSLFKDLSNIIAVGTTGFLKTQKHSSFDITKKENIVELAYIIEQLKV